MPTIKRLTPEEKRKELLYIAATIDLNKVTLLRDKFGRVFKITIKTT